MVGSMVGAGRDSPLLRVVLADGAHGRPYLRVVASAELGAEGVVGRVGRRGSLLGRDGDGCGEGIEAAASGLVSQGGHCRRLRRRWWRRWWRRRAQQLSFNLSRGRRATPAATTQRRQQEEKQKKQRNQASSLSLSSSGAHHSWLRASGERMLRRGGICEARGR